MFKGITRRWVLSTMLVIFIIISLIVTGLIFAIVHLFNSEVERELSSVSKELLSVFEDYKTDNSSTFDTGAKEYVEDFHHKENIEVMAINSSGRVILTSTGFSYDKSENMPDFEEAKKSEDGSAFYHGSLDSGEAITSYTQVITNRSGSAIGAVRYVVSVDHVNSTIVILIMVTGYFCNDESGSVFANNFISNFKLFVHKFNNPFAYL